MQAKADRKRRGLQSLSWLLAGTVLVGSLGAGSEASGSGVGESGLRRVLEQLNADRPDMTPVLDITDAVLRFVPIGTAEVQATGILRDAGLQPTARLPQSPSDARWPDPLGPIVFPCPDPTYKSDHAVVFTRIFRQTFSLRTVGHVELGFRSGAVDFLNAIIRVESLVP